MKQASATSTARNSAIELLRILAMLLIILCHSCYHSGYDYTYSVLTVNRLFLQFGIIGEPGVILFVMISGYFLCNSSFRSQSLSRMLAQVWFYSIALFLVCRFGFGVSYSAQELLAVFFPTVYGEYWFFTAFLILTLLTPFLNLLIRAMDRAQHTTAVVCMLVMWSLIPTVSGQGMYASEIPQFLMYYLLGAWFRRYPDNLFRKKWLRWGLTLGCLAALYALTVVLAYLERYTPEAFGASARFYYRNSAFIIGTAVGLFSLAVYCKPFTNPFVNALSSCTFGVYLIHDNPAVRGLLWKNWLNWSDYFTSGSFILRLVLSVALVYIVCSAMEWIRLKTVAGPMEKAVDALVRRVLKKGAFV